MPDKMTIGFSGPISRNTEWDLATLPADFTAQLRIISEFLARSNDGVDIGEGSKVANALRYFGFSFHEDNPGEFSPRRSGPSRGHAEIDFSGLRARPEWSPIDRVKLAPSVSDLTVSLRRAIERIRSDNGGEDPVMPDVEKSQLIVALKAALSELEDAPYTNKSNLKGLAVWCGKVSLKAAEKSLISDYSAALSNAADHLWRFVQHLPSGLPHLPWF
jgi:hypothetical protein